jgi:cell division GTPase FtsZ
MLEAFKAADNVLRNAVGGIAEIINVPGPGQRRLRGRAHGDGRDGQGHDGFRQRRRRRSRPHRRRTAVASPLLEGIELSGAAACWSTSPPAFPEDEGSQGGDEHRPRLRGDDAHIIFGAVYDEDMGEDIRVTVVATGLGQAQAKRQTFRSDQHRGPAYQAPEPTAASPWSEHRLLELDVRGRRSFARAAAQRSKRWPIAVWIATTFRHSCESRRTEPRAATPLLGGFRGPACAKIR